MKRVFPVILAALMLLLAACAPGPAAEETPTPSATHTLAPEGTGQPFVFTRENFPRLNGSTSAVPLAQAVASVLLGESRDEVAGLASFSRTTASYRALMAGEADLVLTNLKPKQEGLAYQKLLRDPLVIAAPYSGELRRRYPNSANNLNAPLAIDLSQLESETLIVLRSWQNMRVAAEITCRHYNFTPSRVIEAPSLPSALSLVCSGRGITFICPSYVHCIQPQNPLIYFALDQMEGLTDVLAVYRSDTRNRWVQEFCRCAIRKLGDDSAGE